jgi:ligand-binding SRPBCC domain-containing protein
MQNGQPRNAVLAESKKWNKIFMMRKSPLPYVFEYASNLKADPKKVFAFHLEPKNISRVSPSWIRVISLNSPSPIVEGSKISLRVASLGIPQSWEVTVREVNNFSGIPGSAYILDVADKSPFPLWRHLHEFWAAPDGTTGLVDRIEFLPPGGGLGRLLLPFIHKFFLILFRARHEATRKIFEIS